jgi:hypothetical protein
MAITQKLNAKYPNWTQEDWDRFRWINSWNRRRRNIAPLLPCKRCGTAAIFEEDHEDMPYHNMFTLGCPKCHRYLETTTDLSPVQFWGGFGNQKCTFSVVQNRVPLHMVRQMELLQFSRRSTTPSCATDPGPWHARCTGGGKFFSAKMIYNGETSESLVASRQIGPVESSCGLVERGRPAS